MAQSTSKVLCYFNYEDYEYSWQLNNDVYLPFVSQVCGGFYVDNFDFALPDQNFFDLYFSVQVSGGSRARCPVEKEISSITRVALSGDSLHLRVLRLFVFVSPLLVRGSSSVLLSCCAKPFQLLLALLPLRSGAAIVQTRSWTRP